jgi:hypothetical protein
MTTPIFSEGDRVRYKPGTGTYGLEHFYEADGRIPGVVVGFTATRVRVELSIDPRKAHGISLQRKTRCVDAASLIHEKPA